MSLSLYYTLKPYTLVILRSYSGRPRARRPRQRFCQAEEKSSCDGGKTEKTMYCLTYNIHLNVNITHDIPPGEVPLFTNCCMTCFPGPTGSGKPTRPPGPRTKTQSPVVRCEALATRRPPWPRKNISKHIGMHQNQKYLQKNAL